MAKSQIDTVEKQWQDWLEKNPTHEHIDVDNLKKILIEDLTYASKMDVKEYTLYQKWCEVKERYPTETAYTLFDGEEQQLIDKTQAKIVEHVKKNFGCQLVQTTMRNCNQY